MNFLKNNLAIIVVAALAGMFLLLAASNKNKEETISGLNKEVGASTIQVKELNNELNKAEKTNKKLMSSFEKAKAKEKTLSEQVEATNSELYIAERERAEKEERLKNIKSRVKNIAIKRPESLARLINIKNKSLFKRVTKATTF